MRPYLTYYHNSLLSLKTCYTSRKKKKKKKNLKKWIIFSRKKNFSYILRSGKKRNPYISLKKVLTTFWHDC